MIKVLIFDLARVFLYPKDKKYSGGLNELYLKIKDDEDFKFYDYYKLDEEQLEFIKTFKGKYPLYIFTSEVIQNDPAIKSKLDIVFTGLLSALDFGYNKIDPRVYKAIAKKLNLTPSEIWFTDDNVNNIKAAQKAGISAVVYKDFAKLKRDLEGVTLND